MVVIVAESKSTHNTGKFELMQMKTEILDRKIKYSDTNKIERLYSKLSF